MAHIGDWPRQGKRTLEYDTVLGSFTGDWYAAATKYRDWSLKQKWGKPLHQRADVPAWLLESPPYITIRPQGVLDMGPVFPVKELLPYEKCIPLLERVAKRVDASLVAVIMGWERGGSWVYPDCFPPIGGATIFPCFAQDHEHAPVPGKWMAAKMAETMTAFWTAARKAGEKEVIHSTEMCCNEFCLQQFQQSDSRLCPPGHRSPGWENSIPLYQFLFHECIIMHGGMGVAPEPYHLQIRNAYNGVMGEIADGVLIGDGTLLDKDTGNWADWDPKVGDPDTAFEMIRTVTAMRRGAGRNFLVFGRMQAPADVRHVKTVKWQHNGQAHAIPAIFDCAWQAPDGRFAVALANWTNRLQRATVHDARFGKAVVVHTVGKQTTAKSVPIRANSVTTNLPPFSLALVAQGKPHDAGRISSAG